jgi:hypothetical protein
MREGVQEVKTSVRVTWLPDAEVRRTEMGSVNWIDWENTYA